MAKKYRGRNEGSIHQRPDGTWRAQVMVNGKRLSHSAKTKTEILKWLQSIQFQLGQNLDETSSQITVQEYMEQWLESSGLKLRAKTVHQYEMTARKHIFPSLGKIGLRELSPLQVERLYAHLNLSGIGVRTIRLTHGILHSALGKATRLRLIASNPATGATLPRATHAEMQILDMDQISLFLIAANGSSYEAFYHLAITTGMREAELFGLKWSDLQWNSGTLYVKRQIQRTPGQGWKFMEPKTHMGRRTIKVGEETLQRLRIHKQRQEIQKATAGTRWQDNDLIFPSTVGTPGEPGNMRKDFLKTLTKAACL